MRLTTIEFTGDPLVLRADDGGVTVSLPIRVTRYSGRRTIVAPQGIVVGTSQTREPTALQVALARGHRWLRQIESGAAANLADIAKREKVDRSYVSRMVNLTTLAPDIVAAILEETLPENVSLFDLAIDTPLAWEGQRERISVACLLPRA